MLKTEITESCVLTFWTIIKLFFIIGQSFPFLSVINKGVNFFTSSPTINIFLFVKIIIAVLLISAEVVSHYSCDLCSHNANTVEHLYMCSFSIGIFSFEKLFKYFSSFKNCICHSVVESYELFIWLTQQNYKFTDIFSHFIGFFSLSW